MKKVLTATILAVSCVSSYADLCTIITKDPRYSVASFVRNQTACVTTTQAGVSAAKLGPIILTAAALFYLSERMETSAKEELVEILSNDYKIVACGDPDAKQSIWDKAQYIEFLVGKNIAKWRIKSSTDSMTSYVDKNMRFMRYDNKNHDGVYQHSGFSTMALNMNTLKYGGNSIGGSQHLSCKVLEEVQSGD